MIREWRINRVRERIASNKKQLDTMVTISTDFFARDIVEIAGKIGRDQQLLARLQGFAQDHDGELRQPVKLKKKETP